MRARGQLPGRKVGPNANAFTGSGSPSSTQYPSAVPRSISGSPTVDISQSSTPTTRTGSAGSSTMLSYLKSLWMNAAEGAPNSVGIRSASQRAIASTSGTSSVRASCQRRVHPSTCRRT